MTEERARQVANFINKQYGTTEADPLRHGDGWIVVLGPDWGRWYPKLQEMGRSVVENLGGDVGYTVGFDKGGYVDSIYWHDRVER